MGGAQGESGVEEGIVGVSAGSSSGWGEDEDEDGWGSHCESERARTLAGCGICILLYIWDVNVWGWCSWVGSIDGA